ncbi:hypothetical protein F5X71_10145 [Nocardia brasiliensis]|uniref:Uncharacterized protein n=1 Tax=Nocardia brasiliensis TaxID=37326 RepID=A0A6G9XNW7_NOCBR|nr:DUF6670 family protein [Nocardia brasiliensis]QIS02631.1 hypothetical protein F5X71_10145 [Nocardia brasiliensis]
MRPNLFWRTVKPAIFHAMPYLSKSAIRATGRPFTRPEMLRPHVGGHRYGWTHYGVMLPDLPEPHRYFSTMVLAGLLGATAFDNDESVTTTPRDTVTVSTSTAAPDAAFYRAYSMTEQCRLEPDGSRLDFGTELSISGAYPDFRVSVRTEHLTAELRLRATGQVAWFARTPLYDHVSLLVEYDGQITAAGDTTAVSGVGTFEYAACLGPHGLLDRRFGPAAKVPVDFFTYHVVGIDARTQLLLCDVHAMGEPLATLAYHRSVGGPTWVTHDRVRFEVTEYAAEDTVDPYGKPMRLPVRFTWTAGTDLILHGVVDSPPRFGVGRGYIIGYHCHGTFQGRGFTSRGYLEYVDAAAVDRTRSSAIT